MRKAILVVFLAVPWATAVAAPLKPSFPWDCPSPKGNIANSTITTGFVFDCVGLGFQVGAGPGFALGFGVGSSLLDVANIGYAIGGAVMDKGVETRHAALAKKGYKIKTANRATSKKFLLWTLILEGAALGMDIVNVLIGGDLGLRIGAMASGTTASILEVVNLATARTEWVKDINQAVSGKRVKKTSLEDSPRLSPLVSISSRPTASGYVSSSLVLGARLSF